MSLSMQNYLFLCRLCGNETTTNCRINIFDNTGVSLEIITKITKCIGIYIRETDFLPKVMCYECLKQIENMHTFRNMCYETSKKLEDAFENQFNSTLDDQNEQVAMCSDMNQSIQESTSSIIEEAQPVLVEEPTCTQSKGKPPAGRRSKINKRTNDVMYQCRECLCVVYHKETAIQHVEKEHNIIIIRHNSKNVKDDIDVDIKEEENAIKEIESEHNIVVIRNSTNKVNARYVIKDGIKFRKEYFPNVIIKLQMNGEPLTAIASSERPFPCNMCDKTFKDKKTLANHIPIHDEVRQTYSCDLCNKTFMSYHYFRRHKLSHDLSLAERRKFKCTHCKASFTTLYACEYHINSNHFQKSRVECKICFKTFKNENNLKIHSVIHTDNKKVCNVCGKIFARTYLLNNHYIIHTDTRPYNCDHCQKGFVKKIGLVKHLNNCPKKK